MRRITTRQTKEIEKESINICLMQLNVQALKIKDFKRLLKTVIMSRVPCSDEFFIKRLISTTTTKKRKKKEMKKRQKERKKEKILFPLLVRFTF